MYFDSLAALMDMDGHGAFVWSAYAITTVVVIALILMPLRRQRRLLSELSAELRRDRGTPMQELAAEKEERHAPGS